MANNPPIANGQGEDYGSDSWQLLVASTNDTLYPGSFSSTDTGVLENNTTTGIVHMAGFDALHLLFGGTDAQDEQARITIEAVEAVATRGTTDTHHGYLGVPLVAYVVTLGAATVGANTPLAAISGISSTDLIADTITVLGTQSLDRTEDEGGTLIFSSAQDNYAQVLIPTHGATAVRVYCDMLTSASMWVVGRRVQAKRVLVL